MRIIRWLLCVATVLVVVLAGCSKDKEGITRLNGEDAGALSANRNRFETAEDPPLNATSWHAAGQLAESQGAVPAAIERYQAALKIDPNHRPSLYRLGVLFAQQSKFPQAIDAWERYVQASDGDATALSNLGFCYELAGKAADAEATYKRGIAADKSSEPCRVNYGLMLARSGRINEAIVQLQAVLSPAQVHYNLGSVFEQQGKREAAKAEYRKALALDPNASAVKAKLAALE